MKLISIQRDQMQHAKSKCSVVYLDFPFQHLQQNKLTKTVLLSSEILGTVDTDYYYCDYCCHRCLN